MVEKRTTAKHDKGDTSVGRIATIAAGAAIGSAAIAAAVLFATRKREMGSPGKAPSASKASTPARIPPETD